MSLRDRIKAFIDYLGVETRAFELACDLSNGFVNNLGHSMREASLNKIINTYPQLNRNWLLTGDGTMLHHGNKLHSPQKEQTFYKALPQPVLEAKPIRLADPFGFEATNDKIYQLPDESLIMQVPVIPYKAWASYLRGHADPEFYDGLQTMPVPVDVAHKGTYLIFEVGGESMLNPGSRKCIWPGEKIIGRDLKRENWKYKLHYNSTDAWVIVHKERGIVVKEIIAHNVDNGEITLRSWNPDKNEHPDYTVYLEDVEQIFNVVDPFNRFG